MTRYYSHENLNVCDLNRKIGRLSGRKDRGTLIPCDEKSGPLFSTKWIVRIQER